MTTNYEEKESNFVEHIPCSECGSSDGLGVYDDGHGFCYVCEKHYPKGSFDHDASVVRVVKPEPQTPTTIEGLQNLKFSALTARGISEKTCRFWGYQCGQLHGRPVQVAQYYKSKSEPAGAKVRFANKDFLILGEKKLPLYGQWLWERTKVAKQVVVTEGEIDALSIGQIQENKWPVVSVPNGAAGAVRAFKDNLEWLEKFETVVIAFDNDKAGSEAAEKCAQVLSVGKAKIAKLGLNDANEMLLAKRGGDLLNSIWNAKPWRPDGIIAGTDLWDTLTKEEKVTTYLYPWESLNEMTMGLRAGEITTLCSGSGIGKSSVCKEIAHYLLMNNHTVGYIALEESTKRTALGIMGIHLNKPIYLDPALANEEEMKKAFDATVGSGKYYTYDHWGSLGEENLLQKIRYLVTALDCRIIFLDHLSIVVSGMEGGDERRMIDNTMTKLRSLVEELRCSLVVVSHLKRPDGKGHEEGARTTLAQLRGSAGIAQLSDMVIGLERDQQDAAQAKYTTIRVLKNRWCGKNGVATTLEFTEETGRLSESLNFDEEGHEENDI